MGGEVSGRGQKEGSPAGGESFGLIPKERKTKNACKHQAHVTKRKVRAVPRKKPYQAARSKEEE